MPEPSTPSPQTAPPTLPPQSIDPLSPPVPKPVPLENDPNHLIGQMIARRGQKKTEDTAKTPDKPAETPTEPPKENKALGDLISKTLGFRSKQVAKPAEPPPAPPVTHEPPPTETPPDKADSKPKSIVTRRKQKQEPPDALSVATQAASAAATAAVKAVHDRQPQPTIPEVKEDSLKEEDRHEYDVAKYLGTINPKYLGAEKVVLDHVRKAEAYAARWEQQNPGKVFDPNDEDHNEFYAALEKPWSEHEFRMAENEIAAERVASRKEKESQAKINDLTQSTARQELKPIAGQTLLNAATELARSVGDGVLDKIKKVGFEKFSAEDPIVASAIAEVLNPLQPLIESIIELDDPKGRIPFDRSNPNHVAWESLILEKEQQYAGVRDDSGKLFATRAEMHSLSAPERKGRFYLTSDHLVAELVADATELAKEKIKFKKDEGEKIARALGFVKPDGNTTPAKPSDATNPSGNQPPPATPTSTKPASPSDNGSPRIDAPAGNNNSPTAKALQATAGILFAR